MTNYLVTMTLKSGLAWSSFVVAATPAEAMAKAAYRNQATAHTATPAPVKATSVVAGW